MLSLLFSERLTLPKEEAVVADSSVVPVGEDGIMTRVGHGRNSWHPAHGEKHIMSRGLWNVLVLPLMGRKLDPEKRSRSQERRGGPD